MNGDVGLPATFRPVSVSVCRQAKLGCKQPGASGRKANLDQRTESARVGRKMKLEAVDDSKRIARARSFDLGRCKQSCRRIDVS